MFWRTRNFVLGTVAAAALSHPVAAEDRLGPDRFAIRGARIVTGTGATVDHGILLVRDGIVTAVGVDDGTIAVPEDAWVVDAKGKWIYPGFVDALSTLGLPKSPREGEADQGEGPRRGRPREPIARGPEDRPSTTSYRAAADELQLSDERIEKWRSAGFTSAVTVPEEGIFPGQAALINLGGERAGEMVVRTPAALRVNFTPPATGRSFPASLMGVIAYVKQAFADAAYYRASWAAYEGDPLGKHRPLYDRTLAPLVRAQTDGLPVLIPAHRAHEILRAIRVAKESGVSPVLYGLHEGYASAEELGRQGIPALVSLHWPERDKEADPDEEEPLRALELRDRAPSTPAALEKAGARFAFYTDGLAKPEEALASLRKAVAAGLSKERAVRASSLDAVAIFGLSDRMGSLEKGKIANFFIASGDLFEDGAAIESVFVDGRRYENRPPEDTEKSETAKGGKTTTGSGGVR